MTCPKENSLVALNAHNFYSDNINFAPAKVKFRRKHKYEKKLLVWIAMSPRWITEPFIMASGHYAEHSLNFSKLIHHADKVDNPAN